jgi:hypothetical protein
MDQLDNIDTVKTVCYPETEILNQHFVIRLLDQTFDFLHLVGSVYFETVLRKVFTHREADRFFIIYDEQVSRAWVNSSIDCCLFTATEEFSEAAGHRFQVQH